MRMSQKLKGVTMSNLSDTVFFFLSEANLLQNFYICISVPLNFGVKFMNS